MNKTSRSVLSRDHGLSPAATLIAAINFRAGNAMRKALKKLERQDGLEGHEIEQEDAVAKEFGFGIENTMSLDDAVDLVVISYRAGADIARFTEANEKGTKSAPFAWMLEYGRFKTPLQILEADANYRIDSAITAQSTAIEFLRLAGKDVDDIMAATQTRQKALAIERFKSRAEQLKGYINPAVARLSSEEMIDRLEEAIVDLKIDWLDELTRAGEAHLERLHTAMSEGKVVNPDIDLLAFTKLAA